MRNRAPTPSPLPAPPTSRAEDPWPRGGRGGERGSQRVGAAQPGAAGRRRGRRAPGFPAPRGRSRPPAAYLTWPAAAALSLPDVRVLSLHGAPGAAAAPRPGAGPGPRRHPGGPRQVALPAGAAAQPAPGPPARVSRPPRRGWPRDGLGAQGTKRQHAEQAARGARRDRPCTGVREGGRGPGRQARGTGFVEEGVGELSGDTGPRAKSAGGPRLSASSLRGGKGEWAALPSAAVERWPGHRVQSGQDRVQRVPPDVALRPHQGAPSEARGLQVAWPGLCSRHLAPCGAPQARHGCAAPPSLPDEEQNSVDLADTVQTGKLSPKRAHHLPTVLPWSQDWKSALKLN